ncbi:MAG: ribosome biogenesis GTP-binding protein YihA/YsxC, partial [Bacteroidaceae bacterium]|nr:ribosome biogenesis GTP-binding protein YihA/YsxC [Bacteroidaceae bacterium]
MNITSATYIGSKPTHTQCPQDQRPEYAFIGRSNVGKSSLINALTARRNLALTSSTPGKTMCINHFLINNDWYLVDLPGYGYAQRGKKEMEKLKNMISSYVLEREQ